MKTLLSMLLVLALGGVVLAEEGGNTIPADGDGKVIVNLTKDQTYKVIELAYGTFDDAPNYWTFSAVFYHDKAKDQSYSLGFLMSDIEEKSTYVSIVMNYGGVDYMAVPGPDKMDFEAYVDGVDFVPNKDGDTYTVSFNFKKDIKFYKDGDLKGKFITVKAGTAINFIGKKE